MNQSGPNTKGRLQSARPARLLLVPHGRNQRHVATGRVAATCYLVYHRTGWLPLSSEEFVKAALADAAVSANCGFRSWGPQARCEFSDAVYVADAGDIPPSKTFHIKKSCWQSHPGVCVGQDADSALYIRAGKALCSFAISHDLQRTWFKLAVVADSDINVVVDGLELLAYCATIRRADPRVALFVLPRSLPWGGGF